MRRSLSLLAAAVLATSCVSVTKYKPKGELVPYQGFHAKLPSGMQVVVYEVPQIERFSVTVSYGSGSSEDPAGKEGLAHLVEHLAFRTSPEGSAGAPLWDQLTAAGWRFNAATDLDSTDYYEIGKPAELGDALRLEASRMRQPIVGIDEQAFAVEREVVLSEYRERFETSSFGAQLSWVIEGAFAGHPYGRPLGGTPETLRAITLADAKAWTAERYVPRNAVLVVASPYRSREVMQKVLEAFGELADPAGAPQGPRMAKPDPLPPPPDEAAPPRIHKAPVRQPTIWVAWSVPGRSAFKEPQGEAAAAALSRAYSAILYDEYGSHALEKADGWGAFYVPVGGHGLIVLTANVVSPKDADKLIDHARSAAAQLVIDDDAGLASALGERGRKQAVVETRDQLLVDAYLEIEHLDGEAVAGYLRATGQPDYLATRRNNIAGTLNADITSYAAEYLKRDRSVAVIVLPDANGLASGLLGGAAARPSSDDRDDLEDGGWAPPELDRVRDVARAPGLGSVSRRELPNGLTVILARRGTLPIAEVRLVLRTSAAGSAELPAGAPGYALATNDARFARTGANRIGASSWVRVRPESIVRTSSGSAANLEVLIESTAQWARDQKVRYHDEIEDAYLRVVRRWERDPDQLAAQALLGGVFPGHPYAAVPTADELKRAGEAALSAFLSREFRPERATLLITSNQPESPELWAVVERAFGGWASGRAPRAEAPDPGPQRRRLVLVHRPGASQAVVSVGLRVPAWSARDRAATDAVVWLAQNRLMQRLRIAEGVTYGAHAGVLDQQRAGAFVISTAVSRDAAARSLSTALATVKALAEGQVGPREAGRARWQVARGYSADFDTVRESAAALARVAEHGLAPAVLDAEAESIATLDAARIKAAAAALPAGEESIVVSGDAEVLVPQLQAAGFAPEVVRP